jgi:hypothetical protein
MAEHENFPECLHEKSNIVYKVDITGKKRYVRQCVNCGRAVSQQLKTESALIELGFLKCHSFDEELQNEYWKKRSELQNEYWKKESELRQAAAVKAQLDWRNYYEDYLHSEEWEERRKAVFKRDCGVCQSCLTVKATQVHHIRYDNLGHEPLFDLISICTKCHKKLHSIRNERKEEPKKPISSWREPSFISEGPE